MSGYDAAFFEAHRAGARSSAEVLVPKVVELLRPKSVVDVGCGPGTWLSVFRRHGVADVLGVDGSYVDPGGLDIPTESFVAHDLTRPLRLGRSFDLAVSLEVAEHLPPESAAAFVESLVGLAPRVLFSAAIPHQGGEGHVNGQWPAYWAALFAEHDYAPVDCFRRRLWGDERVEWWYAQNVLLYVRRDSLGAMEAEPRVLSLVHPTLYLELVEWGLEQHR
jgi:SAM-dependent methyltransferase